MSEPHPHTYAERVSALGKIAQSSIVEQELAEERLAELLEVCKQWRNATESRIRLLDSRGEVRPLAADAALFEAIDQASGEDKP